MTNHIQEVKKSVSFVFVPSKSGTFMPIGTGFFVSIRNEIDDDRLNIYFVTARHVLQDEKENYFPQIAIKLNLSNGNSELIKIDLASTKIFTHQDRDVDIAIFNCLSDEKMFDFLAMRPGLIPMEELAAIHEMIEGDEVFFTGFFTAHADQKRNQPLIRFGRISARSEEKIEWQEKDKVKFMDLYLVECQSFCGNSGAPVFSKSEYMRKSGSMISSTKSFLAGIMTGSSLQNNEMWLVNTTSNLISRQNIGIAAVTPAYKLHEILFSDEMVKSRATVSLG